MGILDAVRRFASAAGPLQTGAVRASGDIATFEGLTDPYLAQFMRDGGRTQSGASVTVETAMRNTAVLRCVNLISSSIGMLPLHLFRTDAAKAKAVDHPLFAVLYRQPNDWQTAFDFRSLMQTRALVHGNAYALVVRRGQEVRRLIPLDPARVRVEQDASWKVTYRWSREGGGETSLPAADVFHLRGPSLDGLRGLSTVKQAAEAIGLSLQAENAAARMFSKGMMVGGALTLPEGRTLSPEALARLKASIEERYSSAENAGKWLLLEEGMDAKTLTPSAKDNQHLETRRHQIEEIARAFGVPRPFLMVDDTSWGTGIEVLGQAFVRNCLAPWFAAWEQAISLRLLTPAEQDLFYAKFNAGALERGNLKDQGEFFAKALGSGGHAPWMHQDEVRELMELGPRDDLPAAPGATPAPTSEDDDDGTSDAGD
ncbi:phage portal protein [Acuticoccus sediminis]|uniref:phage portal protein n=1 Tax=Acuticoccus sediminis TaxID=2184697 RepID=UPI001CFDC8B5|nr:phage portal protein [Acuticoccus sediminis]